jgi:hypothetical protein
MDNQHDPGDFRSEIAEREWKRRALDAESKLNEALRQAERHKFQFEDRNAALTRVLLERDELRSRLDSYRRAIGLIRAKAVIWPSCAANASQWFQEIIDVCDLATHAPVVERPVSSTLCPANRGTLIDSTGMVRCKICGDAGHGTLIGV